MSGQILIVHAQDSVAEAVSLASDLKQRSFDVVMYKEAKNRAGLGTPIITFLESLVEDYSAIIIIPSPEFLKDGFLKRIAELAIYSHKFVPVLIGSPSLELPLWFTMYSYANLNDPKSHEYEMNRLVGSLAYKIKNS